MDADQAAIVFVEICSRLDAMVESQRRTNDLLAALESAFKDHLEALTDDRGDALTEPPPQLVPGNLPRGLGNLMPYGDNTVHPTAVSAP